MKQIYKRLFLCLLAACMLGTCLCGCSKEKEEETTEKETVSFAADFYKITDENKTLEIELEADPEAGKNWTYEISDESILTLSSFTFNPTTDEENAKAEDTETESTGTVWYATFSAPGNKGGSVQLKLYSVQKGDGEAETVPVYTMDISVAVDGRLTVKSIQQ